MKLLSATIFRAVMAVCISAAVLCGLAVFESNSGLSEPETQARSMIIGGVPVHEQDYKLPREDGAFGEAVAQDDNF